MQRWRYANGTLHKRVKNLGHLNHMSKEMSPEIWARQLSCPEGEEGEQVALEMNRSNINMIHTTLQNLPCHSDMDILEIGPGNGAHLTYLFSLFPHVHYTGLERSHSMLQACKRICAANLTSYNTRFVLSESDTLPFENESFDALFSVNTLYFWKEPLTYLTDCFRVLKKGGTLHISFGDKGYMEQLPFTPFGFQLYYPADVLRLFEQSPFKHCTFSTHDETITHRGGKKYQRKFHIATAQKNV